MKNALPVVRILVKVVHDEKAGARSRLTTCRLPRQPTLLTDMHFFKGVEVTRSAKSPIKATKKYFKDHQKVLQRSPKKDSGTQLQAAKTAKSQ